MFFKCGSKIRRRITISLTCLRINTNVTIAVSVSAQGDAIHTPFIPKIAGNISINASNSTIPRSDEIIADDFASPQLVKYMEPVTSYPIARNVIA